MNARRWMTGVVLYTVFLSTCSGADEPAVFRFTRPIQVEGLTQDELVTVPLDSDVYAATREGFPDLRVVGADEQLVPFLIRRVSESRTQNVRKTWTADKPELELTDGDGMQIRFTLKPDDPSPRGLRFVTPLRDFEQQVRVFGIVDGAESAIVEESLIFDYSKFMDVRRVDVPFPATTARQFRIVVDTLTSEQQSQLLELTRSITGDQENQRVEKTTISRRPFRIDRIELWNEQAEETHQANVITAWLTSDFQVVEDGEHKITIAEFTSRHEPLTALRVQTGSQNFSRPARVQTGIESDGGVKWTTVTEAAISQFQLRDLKEEHLTVNLPETRHDRYRLVIENADNSGLKIDGIEVVGHQHELVLLKTPDLECRLIYGSDTATPLNLDTAALNLALAQKISPVAATLGPQFPITTVAVTKPAELKSLLNNPILLGAIVGVLVIALGWGLFQASKRIDQSPVE